MWSLGYNQVPDGQETADQSPTKSRLVKSDAHFFPENFRSSDLFSSTSSKSQSDESSRLKQSQHSAPNSESEAETPSFPNETKESLEKQTNKEELCSSFSSNNNRNEMSSESNQPNSEIDEDFVFVESAQFLSENKAKLKPGKKISNLIVKI